MSNRVSGWGSLLYHLGVFPATGATVGWGMPMSSRKDYVRAARLVQDMAILAKARKEPQSYRDLKAHEAVLLEEAFASFFREEEDSRFDETRFRFACRAESKKS
jgi:hypothetical protein